MEAALRLPDIIAKGTATKQSSPLKWSITWQGNILVLSKENSKASFGITSFDMEDSAPKSLKNEGETPKIHEISKIRKKRMARSIKRENQEN